PASPGKRAARGRTMLFRSPRAESPSCTKMSKHRTLGGQRPVHPECPKLDRDTDACQCDELWDYWDGTDAALDRLIKSHEREESRNKTTPATGQNWPIELDEIKPDEEDLGGFWRESERLKSLRKND